MRAGNIFYDIHRVLVQVDVVDFVLVRPDFYGTDQLIVGIVADRHVALGFHDNRVGAGIVDGDLTLAFSNRPA